MDKQLASLQHKNKILLIQAGVALGILLVINWFVLTVLSTQRKQLIEDKRTIERLKEENASVSQTIGFLSNNTEALAQLARSVPNEERFLDFVTSVEKIAKEFSTDSVLRFGSTVPIKDKTNLYVPFSLNFTTPAQQVAPFLRRFERLPYLTHIISLDIAQSKGGSESNTVQLSARIYVENPFSN